MINDILSNKCPSSSQPNEVDDRLDSLEQAFSGIQTNFGTVNLTAENADIQNLVTGKQKATAIDVVSLKANAINVNNLDIDGPINIKNATVEDKFIAKTADIDNADIRELTTTAITTANATIDNLTVGQIKAKDSNTMLNDLTVAGTASINKLNLGDPSVDAINPKVLGATTANIITGNIRHLGGVDDAKIRNIRLGSQIARGDSIQRNMMKLLGDTAMQVGDADNQVVLKCDSRPLWNDKVIATLDDLGDKIVPSYKGRIATEAFLPEKGVLGDYYIITMLTKGDKSGIGFALYNGSKFDTDFFYELEGYRLSADQDIIDDAQDTAISNEIERAKVTENNLFENGVRKVQAKPIAGNNLNINLLFGAEHFGERYTGFGKDFIDGVLPSGEENVGCSLDILPNSHNTVQIMTTNHPTEARVFIRSYGNSLWTDWKKVATSSDKVADSERLEGRTLIELRQMLFNDAHPVGDTFVSNDGNDDPNTIYNKNGIASIWTYVGQSFGIHGWRRTE